MDAAFRRLWRKAAAEPTQENLAALGAAFLRSMDWPERVLKFVGRRWSNRRTGNTVHTVAVYLDDEHIASSGVVGGYGEQYAYTGWSLALANSDLPPPEPNEALWHWAERNRIKIEQHVSDVPRQRDL